MNQALKHGTEIDELPKRQRKHHVQKIVAAEEERTMESEKELAQKIETILETRHQRIRQSRLFPLIAKMAASGVRPLSIVQMLREKEPETFGEERMTHTALHSQVVRFAREVIDNLHQIATGQQGQSMPFTLFDYMGEHYKDQKLNPIVRLEVAILTQCQRVEKLYATELEMSTLIPDVSRELKTYYQLLERYVALRKLLGMEIEFVSLNTAQRQLPVPIEQFYNSLPTQEMKERFRVAIERLAQDKKRLERSMSEASI